jgi:hypothetical protein
LGRYKGNYGWVPVAHTYNPSYSGGRDQEDHGLKPAGQIVCKTLSQKAFHKNRAGGVAQGEGPEFNSSTTHSQKKVIMTLAAFRKRNWEFGEKIEKKEFSLLYPFLPVGFES